MAPYTPGVDVSMRNFRRSHSGDDTNSAWVLTPVLDLIEFTRRESLVRTVPLPYGHAGC